MDSRTIFSCMIMIILTCMSELQNNASGSILLQEETMALLGLKASFQTSSLEDWNQSKNVSPCSWSGVLCDSNFTKVVGLNLHQKNLTGTISDHIQDLGDLLELNFSRNLFSGLLPASIFNLSKLRTLDISRNNFNGSFPDGVSKLKSLITFDAFSNSFSGPLPVGFVEIPPLEELNLGGSYFEGSIPAEYGFFGRNLQFLHLAGNFITGPIPPELGKLQSLRHMEIGYNSYYGSIPPELGNMTKLEYLDIAGANLSGSLPPELSKLGNLHSMFIFRNNLSGLIPPEMGNMTSMVALDLSVNLLSGPIPESFTKLKNLSLLSLMYNNLNGSVPQGMAELPNLETFLIWDNFFSGNLPPRLGQNSKLRWLDVSTNDFTGLVPPDLCAGGKLYKLILFSNGFQGEIPASLATCISLWRFRVEYNALSGRIPSGLGRLPNLTFMDLSINNFTGGFPADLTTGQKLQYVNVSHNFLGGRLPAGIWSSPSLEKFSAVAANLSGILPSFTRCGSLRTLELKANSFSGTIPADIAFCRNLQTLDFSNNKLSGLIPAKLARIPDINHIDLSHNELDGTIPGDFNNCSSLKSFNVSFNDLSGPVPSEGMFRHINSSVFAGNRLLCGGVMNPCFNSADSGDSNQMHTKTRLQPLVWVMGAGFAVSVFIVIVGGHCFYKRYKSQIICGAERSAPGNSLSDQEGPWKMTSFGRLSFTVDDVLKAMKTSNMIGTGPSSSVYKAHMPGGDVIAVKKLHFSNSKLRETALQEVEHVLGNLTHKNVLRLLGFCYNNDTSVLVVLHEFMPNGSLDYHMNSNQNFEWSMRYRIARGMAEGLSYLLHDCNPMVVHRDLKPSNVLLDGQMEVRLADFGLSKFLQTEVPDPISPNAYAAPECGLSSELSDKADVFSFGAIVLELLAGRRPQDLNGITVADWARRQCNEIQSTDGSLMEILDKKMISSVKENQAMLLLHVALLCTNKTPSDRPTMRDVVSMMSETKPARKTVLDFHSTSQGRASAFQIL